MITFKRTRKRSYQHPWRQYFIYGVASAFVLMLALTIGAFASRGRMAARLEEAQEMMAAYIQRDMNEVLDSYVAIDRKSADLAGDILPTMKKHMYSANSMNRVLTETFGDRYSMIDDEQYESFESIMDEFDNLLATGQSTSPAKDRLVTCMDSIKLTLANRFTTDGSLLPKTASK